MQEFHEEHPQYSPELLTFLLEFMTINFWPRNSFMPELNECDIDCTRGQAEPCGCTCSVDALSMSDDEVGCDGYYMAMPGTIGVLYLFNGLAWYDRGTVPFYRSCVVR